MSITKTQTRPWGRNPGTRGGEQREPITHPLITEAARRAEAQGGIKGSCREEDPSALGLSTRGIRGQARLGGTLSPEGQNLCSRPDRGRAGRRAGAGRQELEGRLRPALKGLSHKPRGLLRSQQAC